MAFASPDPRASPSPSHRRLSVGFIFSLMALCARHASRVSRKLKPAHRRNDIRATPRRLFSSPRSPLATPKHLFAQISNKAITLVHHRHRDHDVNLEEFGDGGVWQKSILMGDKCQPPDFSGVIYYDSSGKQIDEFPLKSPRASPLPAYMARVD